MSDDPLAGLPRPLGTPGTFTGLGRTWAAGSTALGHTSQALIGMTGRVLAQAWSGQAATACAGACTNDAGLVATSADAYSVGGAALSTYGTQLDAAQQLWDRARRLADQALADEAAHVKHLQSLAAQAAAAPSSSTPLGPTLIGVDPAPASSPSGIDSLLTAGLRGPSAPSAPSFPTPLDFLWQSPLRGQARAMAQQAINDAQRAANTAAGALEQTVAPFVPKATPKAAPQKKKSHWYSPVTNFAGGAWDAVKDPAVMVGGLVGLHGDTGKNWSDLWGGLEHGVTHPLDFGKALIDWQDLSKGHYSRWAGELVPSVAAAFLTGGAAAGVKGADALGVTAKTGKALDELSEADKAALLARGEPLVPGSVGFQAEAKYVTASGNLDYSGVFDSELKNFSTITTNGSVTLDHDLWLANLHDGSAALNAGRSLKYAAPLDEVLGSSRGGFLDRLALPPQWGPRTDVSVIHIPQGTDVTLAEGTTAPQASHLVIAGKDLGTVGTKSGGGVQVLLKDVDKNWVVWSGKSPYPTTANIAAHAAAGGAVVRVPDALADIASH